MAKTNIKEIARLANVSPAAVSIVINNKKGVGNETRKKIKEIIEKHQYVPNPSSRRLLFNRTNNIAVLSEKSTSPLKHFFYSEINTTILEECEKLDYNLVFASAGIKDGKVRLPNVIKSYDVDGIIIYGDIDIMVLNELKKFEIPFIVIDSHKKDKETLCVNADYFIAAYTAVSHLIEMNHKNIAYIGNGLLNDFSTQTFSGYKKALEESEIIMPLNWFEMDATDEQTAFNCMKKILSCSRKPTAVFCIADTFAIGAIKCIKSFGLRVPEDISVISIDDIILSQYIEPALTTVKIDKVEMGRLALQLLIKKIKGQAAENVTIPSDNLIIRNSVSFLQQ